MSGHYIDDKGNSHFERDHPHSVLWRKIMQDYMVTFQAAGLDAIEAANLMINGAGYYLGSYMSEHPVERKQYTEQLIAVFRSKVEQAVHEGRKDRATYKANQ